MGRGQGDDKLAQAWCAVGEAASMFSDSLAYTFDDPDHPVAEQRLLTFGFSQSGHLLAVVHVERGRASKRAAV